MEPTLTDLIQTYQPGPTTVRLVQTTPIVLLVGISGAGKDTIKQQLLATGDYHHIVSHTTRPPRANAGVLEQDGNEYHFISLDQATTMLKTGAYVEAKLVHGTVYGTSVAEITAAHDTQKIALTDLDVQGVAEYKAISNNVIALFILPPSYDEWQRRLYGRYQGQPAEPADIAKRMQSAITELQEVLAKPYYHFIINDDLDRAVHIADKIAHNHDEFNKVDAAVREQAEKLLAAIQQAAGTLDD